MKTLLEILIKQRPITFGDVSAFRLNQSKGLS